jgi:hypothetical protein
VKPTDDLIERVKRRARRVTPEEEAEANLRMFERMGLDIDDLERMAKAVDLEVDDLLLLPTGASISPLPRRIIGKPGRKNTTKEIAAFAAVRREQGRTWREIFDDWKHHHPDDAVVKHPDTIREAYRRHYGDKANKPY